MQKARTPSFSRSARVDDDLVTLLSGNFIAKGPSSTCYPEFIWACIGDTTDLPPNTSLGEDVPGAICFPEVDANDQPIVRDGPGAGRWVEAKMDLSKYKGRKIWIRFLTTHVQWTGNPTWGIVTNNLGGNADDGWYVDDIRISGTSTPFDLKTDTKPPPASSCPSVLCNSLVAKVSGSTYITQHDNIDNDGNGTVDEEDDAAYNTVATGAPLQVVLLNALDFQPSTGVCINGVLQYRFWEDLNNDGIFQGNELLRDFSENPTTTANPLCSETIKMDERCSSAPAACSSTATLAVTVAGQLGPFTSLTVGADKTTIQWAAQLAAVSYDVSVGHNIGPDTLSSPNYGPGGANFRDPHVINTNCVTGCLVTSPSYNSGGACNLKPTVAGTADMWAVRARGGTWVATWDEGGNQVGTRDTPANASGIPACP